MIPQAQTVFSVTLFLALSFLLAWSHRRHRNRTAANQRETGPSKTV